MTVLLPGITDVYRHVASSPCYLHNYINLVSADYLTETALNLKTKSTTFSLHEEPVGHDLHKRINSNQDNLFRCQMDGSDNKLCGTKG